jgi:hypothetical protein
MIALWGSSFFS